MPERDPPDHDSRETSRFRRLGRRLFGEGEEREREGRDAERAEERGEERKHSVRLDAREVLGAIWEGGDRAKTEVVRAVAREVRNYIEELGLKEDLRNLMTNYSLEVKASIHLRRLAPEEKGAGGEGEAKGA